MQVFNAVEDECVLYNEYKIRKFENKAWVVYIFSCRLRHCHSTCPGVNHGKSAGSSPVNPFLEPSKSSGVPRTKNSLSDRLSGKTA